MLASESRPVSGSGVDTRRSSTTSSVRRRYYPRRAQFKVRHSSSSVQPGEQEEEKIHKRHRIPIGQPGNATTPFHRELSSKRNIGNPSPLGLSAFALTTFILSTINMGVLGVNTPAIVISSALAYGGLVQLLAGMW